MSVQPRSHLPAWALLDGDLLELGSDTYVLVARAATASSQTEVTIYNGVTPNDRPTLRYPAGKRVTIRGRHHKP